MFEVKDIPDYRPIKGFYDLRKLDIPKKLFVKLWEIQDVLGQIQEDKDYMKEWSPAHWEKALEMAAEYHKILMQYERLFD
jgi:hypothetical protein